MILVRYKCKETNKYFVSFQPVFAKTIALFNSDKKMTIILSSQNLLTFCCDYFVLRIENEFVGVNDNVLLVVQTNKRMKQILNAIEF
jgi:hypothetical protein